MSNTAPSRAGPVVVFPLSQWCPPQETSQPHPPHRIHNIRQHLVNSDEYVFKYLRVFSSRVVELVLTFIVQSPDYFSQENQMNTMIAYALVYRFCVSAGPLFPKR